MISRDLVEALVDLQKTVSGLLNAANGQTLPQHVRTHLDALLLAKRNADVAIGMALATRMTRQERDQRCLDLCLAALRDDAASMERLVNSLVPRDAYLALTAVAALAAGLTGRLEPTMEDQQRLLVDLFLAIDGEVIEDEGEQP